MKGAGCGAVVARVEAPSKESTTAMQKRGIEERNGVRFEATVSKRRNEVNGDETEVVFSVRLR